MMNEIAEERLSDRLAIGMLALVYPPEMIERAIRRCGRLGMRNRLLPPQIMVYFVLIMCLFPNESYEAVARLLAESLPLTIPGQALKLGTVPSTAAVSRARMRLGVEPMKALFADAARLSAPGGGHGTRYRGWRLRTLDGRVTNASDFPDPAAVADDGQPGAASSALRVSVLAEDGTGLLLGAEIHPAAPGRPVATAQLLDRLGLGDLLLADGEYACPRLWHTAVAKGVDLLWSVPDDSLPAQPVSRLPDGSWLYRLPPPGDPAAPAARVRVIGAGPGGGPRLATTLLDPAVAPAAELRGLHADRWSFVRAAGQLQALRRSPKKAFRSRSPEMIEQELWGYLLLYGAMRKLSNNRFP
ncbi:transposase domain-containing protein [Streptomyces sp. NBC_00631]|uniref:transposase domain-containing protein n=1 Tax=Streptomyces sp. NBC_00631 TaxID=2975793 RepID=UPI0030DEEBE8